MTHDFLFQPLESQAVRKADFSHHELMMDDTCAHEVTELLLSWREGDVAALDRLVPLVYEELRRMARRRVQRQSAGQPLQATALVHELFLRFTCRRQTR